MMNEMKTKTTSTGNFGW